MKAVVFVVVVVVIVVVIVVVVVAVVVVDIVMYHNTNASNPWRLLVLLCLLSAMITGVCCNEMLVTHDSC